jgi:hypothetical protein
MTIGMQAAVAIVAAVSCMAFQGKPAEIQAAPKFEDFRIPATAMFNGAPAAPQFQTRGQREFRTMIRQAAKKGPNFAGNYTIAEWGCGTACEQIAVVDLRSGDVYDGPFGKLPRAVIFLGPNVEEDKTGMFYHLNTNLFIVRGCPNYKMCGEYYYEWTGSEFRLLHRIPMKPLLGSEAESSGKK